MEVVFEVSRIMIGRIFDFLVNVGKMSGFIVGCLL